MGPGVVVPSSALQWAQFELSNAPVGLRSKSLMFGSNLVFFQFRALKKCLFTGPIAIFFARFIDAICGVRFSQLIPGLSYTLARGFGWVLA